MNKTVSLKDDVYYGVSSLRIELEKERDERITFSKAVEELLANRMQMMRDQVALKELVEKEHARADAACKEDPDKTIKSL